MNCSKLLAAFRLPRIAGLSLGVAVAALVVSTASVQVAEAIVIKAGELVVDLRASDLDAGSNTWTNLDTTDDTVGDFVTKDTLNLNVAADISDLSITVPKSLNVSADHMKAVLSSSRTPGSLEGNNTRSVETWIYANSTSGSSTPVGWGQSGDDDMSSFRYTGNGGNGMFSMWFNDIGWGGAELPVGEWVHVVWTYDASFSSNSRGYINGQLINTGTLDPLTTTHNFLAVGAGREAGTDGFDGYIADVRVHTGVLSETQVLNNFEAGIDPEDGLLCDFDGDGDCDSIDFGIVRDNLFTEGGVPDGDANRDGYIDLEDYRLVKDDPARVIGVLPAPAGSMVATPEPTSVGMGLVALLLSMSARRVTRRA